MNIIFVNCIKVLDSGICAYITTGMTYQEALTQYMDNADYMATESRTKAGLFVAAGYILVAFPKRFELGGTVGTKKEVDIEQIRLSVAMAVSWLNHGGGLDGAGDLQISRYNVEGAYRE